MDATLLAFLQSRESVERELLLERLILEEAAPSVRQTIRYRLRFYIAEDGTSPSNPDAEDLYHDILARLMRALNRLSTLYRPGVEPPDPPPSEIRDFRQYAMRVAANGCNDYLRLRYPRRTRLRDRIRDQLERQPEFAIWRSSKDEQLCGLVEWRGRPLDGEGPARLRELEYEPERLRRVGLLDGLLRPGVLGNLLEDLFLLVGGPVEFESVVGIVALVMEVRELQYESLDAGGEAPWAIATPRPGPVLVEEWLEERVALGRLWEVWLTLPIRQRETFLFSFSTSRGEDLLTLLFESGIVTPVRMASQLGVPLERLMAIWKEMPLRNVELAAMWGVGRQQVNKWRFQANRMIGKRLAGRPDAGAGL